MLSESICQHRDEELHSVQRPATNSHIFFQPEIRFRWPEAEQDGNNIFATDFQLYRKLILGKD